MEPHKYIFESRSDEPSLASLEIEGDLPRELKGTFLANGPGITQVGPDTLHLFDAHGRVVGITLEDGRARLRARHVRTPLLAEELAAGRQTRRRIFTNKPGRWSNLFDLKFGNNAMHNVVAFGGKVLATQDPGHFALDATTLETQGAAPYQTLVPKGGSITPMPRFDPASGRMIVWISKPGMKDSVRFVELDTAFQVARKNDVQLPRGGVALHDVAFSERFFVAIQFAALSAPTALWGAKPPFGALSFDPRSTAMLIVSPREGGETFTVPLGTRAHFHVINAFEREGRLVVDSVGYERLPDFSAGYPDALFARLGRSRVPTAQPTLVRYEIDLDARKVLSTRVIAGVAGEAPEVHPAFRGRACRYVFVPSPTERGAETDTGAYFWFHGLARVDMEDGTHETWNAGASAIPSPVAFVPRGRGGAEDDGWCLSWVQHPLAQRSELCVFDARAIAKGPIARVRVPALLGMLSHVHWAGDVMLAAN